MFIEVFVMVKDWTWMNGKTKWDIHTKDGYAGIKENYCYRKPLGSVYRDKRQSPRVTYCMILFNNVYS